MSSEGSVTRWLGELKAGESAAAQLIWERYVERLIAVARRKLGTTRRGGADEEDVVAAAFEGLWFGVQNGRFPRLDDRDDLWQVLVLLTDRRATDAVRRSLTRQRHEVGESALAGSPDRQTTSSGIDQIAGLEPTPEFAAEMIENLDLLLERLEDESLRKIAVWKLEGNTHEEIAGRLGCVVRTVERKVSLIRQRFSEI